jgi:NAD(P)-dependent dehydrogenase (short-subunit alcohol dehydrogenase family)
VSRAALVTGAGGGIGSATAVALAARGVPVACADVDPSAAEATASAVRAAGAEALALPLDVTDDDAVAGAVAAAEERLGGLGLVAALAAIEGAIAPIEEYDPATFDRVLAVNVRGVYLTLRHALPALRRGGTGSVVTVASQAGLRGVPGLSGYVASKHAVVGLTKGVALEAARDGIRVNCVCPGPTDTRMMRDIEDVVRAAGGDPSNFVDRIPVGRYGQPEEIAALIVWLLVDAPAFLTGAVLPVDGAMTTP